MRWLGQAFLAMLSIGFLGAIAAIGLVFAIFAHYGKDLPDYSQLKNYQPPIITRIYAGDGRLLAEYAQERRVFVPIEVIPKQVKDAFIAAEDQNFYTHSGVDPMAIARAVVTNLKGGRMVGRNHRSGHRVSQAGGTVAVKTRASPLPEMTSASASASTSASP